MLVVRLECHECGTEVTGEYDLCPVCRIEGEGRRLFDLFLSARGNLKEVQRTLGLSYPTTRLRIDEMFRQLGQTVGRAEPGVVLEKIRSGEISVEEAVGMLRSGE